MPRSCRLAALLLLLGTSTIWAQDTCNWMDGGPMPGTWDHAPNWSCSGGSWPGDSGSDTAILDAGVPVNVVTPAGGLTLLDLIITDASVTVVVSPATPFTTGRVIGDGELDASPASSVNVTNDLVIGTFVAPTTLTTVGGSLDVADAMFHSNGTVDLNGSGSFGAAGEGFWIVNVQGAPYVMSRDTVAEQLVVNGTGGLDIDASVLVITSVLDISTAGSFFGGDGVIVVTDGAGWLTSGGSLTPENGAVVFDGTGPTIPAETWGYLVVTGVRSAGAPLGMQGLSIDSGATLTMGALSLAVSPGGVDGGGTLSAPTVPANITGGITVANLLHNNGTIILDGPGDIGGGLGFYNLDLNSAGAIHNLLGPVTVVNELNFNTGGIDVSADNHSITVGGMWNNTAIGFSFREGTVFLTGTGVAGDIFNGEFYNLDITSGASRSATSDLYVAGNLNIDGILDMTLWTLAVGL